MGPGLCCQWRPLFQLVSGKSLPLLGCCEVWRNRPLSLVPDSLGWWPGHVSICRWSVGNGSFTLCLLFLIPLWVCVGICVYVSQCVHMWECVYVCAWFVCAWVHVSAWVHAHAEWIFVYIRVHMSSCVCRSMCTETSACCKSVCVHMRTCMHECVCDWTCL